MKRHLAAIFFALSAACVFAGEGHMATPLRDPWVPPAARATAPMPQTSGETLRAQVERKLHASFDSADAERKGSITREQARTARLAVVEQNFEAIDKAHKGRVTFEDYKRFLRARGARTL